MKKASLLFLLAAAVAHADNNVTVYDRAPSVEELQRQLTGGGEAAPQRKVRTRAIVFGDSAPAAQETTAAPAAPAAAGPAAAAPAPAPSVARPQAASAPAAGASMQVSEKAIAFPINFRVNSAEIMPESVPFLDSIAGLLHKDPAMRLLVEGHTDSSGNSGRNLVLSRERAFSVMNYLIDHYGIDPTRLVPIGKGFSEPLGGLTPDNPKNRRVQFRIIG